MCQRIAVGIPSGVVMVQLARPAKAGSLSPGQPLPATYSVPELRHAIALYREGISSNNPFHQFLTLWKAYENACAVRGQWKRTNKRKDRKANPEVFPTSSEWSSNAGRSFDHVKQELWRTHRLALAHGDVREGNPLTGASAEDLMTVAGKLYLIRYMARITIENVKITLSV